MKEKKTSLNTEELKNLFAKYDKNNDKKLDELELHQLVKDILDRLNHDRQKKSLTPEVEKEIINKTVKDIIRIKDKDKNGVIDLEEFLDYYQGQDIFETTECKHFLHYFSNFE